MYKEVHEERRVYRYVNRLVGAEQKTSRGIVTKVGSVRKAKNASEIYDWLLLISGKVEKHRKS